MITIESKENNLFKDTKKLKDRKGRTKSSKYIIEGFRLVEEAFKARISIEYLFLQQGEEEKLYKYLGEYLNNTKIFILREQLFRELSSTSKPQGIIAVVKIIENQIKKEENFYLLCDKIQDPGNLGTIIRTAHAAGVDGIILTKGTVDIFNDKTIRATMGSMFYVPILFEDDNLTITKSLINKGFSLLATSLEGENDFFKEDLTGKVVVTVGNEGNGVSNEIYDLCTKKVKIPMPGGAESLNVGVATSIILYEKVRQSLIIINE